ncbi:MAG: YlbF family regulator [Clostridia bacterium]|nr:YlbF family regulator [Clostridia bacterium]
MDYSLAHQLARELKNSEEWQTYHQLRETVMGDETQAALIQEYRKLQVNIQMAALSGKSPDNEDMQRFSGITALLYSKPEVSQFLLSELRLQQTMADLFKILTEAADLDLQIPGLS